jgi:hypothetical protein
MNRRSQNCFLHILKPAARFSGAWSATGLKLEDLMDRPMFPRVLEPSNEREKHCNTQ